MEYFCEMIVGTLGFRTVNWLKRFLYKVPKFWEIILFYEMAEMRKFDGTVRASLLFGEHIISIL